MKSSADAISITPFRMVSQMKWRSSFLFLLNWFYYLLDSPSTLLLEYELSFNSLISLFYE